MTDTLHVEYIPLDQLSFWDRNPKAHDLGALIRSFERHGFKQPPRYEPTLNDGAGGIVAGNGRIEALMAMRNAGHAAPRGIEVQDGAWFVPVLFGVDAASQAAAEAYGLDDNNMVMAGGDFTAIDQARAWNANYLDLLQELAAADELPVSVDGDDLDALLAYNAPEIVPGNGGDEFDTTPDDGPTRAQLGDLWIIGGVHRLLVGDCTDPANVARLMQGERAVAVLTDPPYGMDLDTDWSDAVGQLTSTSRQHQTRGNTYDRVIGDDKPFDPTHIFEFFGYCKEIFLWGADYYAESIPDRNEGSWLVWDKRKESQADAIGSEFELCWSKAKHKRRMLRHDWFGFLSSSNAAEARNRVHPNQKPTTLLVDIINQWIDDGIFVDLYLGSGTTLIAAHRTGRRCYGMEIAPKYADVILRRAEAEGLTVERVDVPHEAVATP